MVFHTQQSKPSNPVPDEGGPGLPRAAAAVVAVTAGVLVSLAAPAGPAGSTLGVGRVAHAGDGADGKPTGPAEMSADDVARRVQKFYKKTDDYHASFKQAYVDAAAGSTKKSHGKVYFKKPGKMRWDYFEKGTDAPKKLLVSDGTNFWVYQYDFKQVFKKCIGDSKAPTSLKFLMGQGELLDEFNVSFGPESTAEHPMLELIPKEPTSKYTKLVFKLDPKTFQVQQSTVYDPYGNKNRITFGVAKINKNLPDSGFDFKPPEGARLLNPQKKCPGAGQ